ncbi:transposase, partial [Rhizobium johnstonii]
MKRLTSPYGCRHRPVRYASDLTDREWGLISPCLPGPRRLGRPRSTDLR